MMLCMGIRGTIYIEGREQYAPHDQLGQLVHTDDRSFGDDLILLFF